MNRNPEDDALWSWQYAGQATGPTEAGRGPQGGRTMPEDAEGSPVALSDGQRRLLEEFATELTLPEPVHGELDSTLRMAAFFGLQVALRFLGYTLVRPATGGPWSLRERTALDHVPQAPWRAP